jgi:glycosyltransferase involved in cell wall biosynthesis
MDKRKVLCWSDAPTAGTGFGVVAKHVIGALYETGKYDIDHLAINFHGEFVDKEECPWNLQPARLLDPDDPHGMKMFFRTLLRKDYDIVWVCNDLFVTAKITDMIPKIKERARARGVKPPVFIYYYPVDCKVKPEATGFLKQVDIPVCYTGHGREETLATCPELADNLEQIPHGVDTSIYKKCDPNEVAIWKHQYFGVSPLTTVVVSVNRNTQRKQIPYSIMAFKEFRKHCPDSIMYIHASKVDQGGDMMNVLRDLNFDVKTDVIFPARYSPAHPAPLEIMNRLYNCGDIFLTTHLGEGWGLTVTEAMAAGVPVVAPRNTSMPQQLGEKSERGYMYECKDVAWIDNSGFREKGLLPDIVNQMVKAWNDNRMNTINPKVIKARTWAEEHDWKEIGKKWIELFSKAETMSETVNTSMMAEEI